MSSEARPGPSGTASGTFARGLHVLIGMVDAAPARIDAVAKRLNLPLSTTYRYVRTLCDMGFLQERNGVYVSGPRLWQLARRGDWHEWLVTVVTPVLRSLAEGTKESAFLLVRVGTAALCLASEESQRHIRLSFRPGTARPLYAGASAKVLLAHAPSSVIDMVIGQGMEPITENTPGEERLRKQLERIRVEGIAITYGELDPDAVGVAAPVRHNGEVVCALSVAGPASRFDGPRLGEVKRAVLEAAGRIEDLLAGS